MKQRVFPAYPLIFPTVVKSPKRNVSNPDNVQNRWGEAKLSSPAKTLGHITVKTLADPPCLFCRQ